MALVKPQRCEDRPLFSRKRAASCKFWKWPWYLSILIKKRKSLKSLTSSSFKSRKLIQKSFVNFLAALWRPLVISVNHWTVWTSLKMLWRLTKQSPQIAHWLRAIVGFRSLLRNKQSNRLSHRCVKYRPKMPMINQICASALSKLTCQSFTAWFPMQATEDQKFSAKKSSMWTVASGHCISA